GLVWARGATPSPGGSAIAPSNAPASGQPPVPAPISGPTQAQATSGEAAIDLTAAGVFPPNSCEHFGSAYVKSRSSASFTAEMKDFIAPTTVHISNCPDITVTKVPDAPVITHGDTARLHH